MKTTIEMKMQRRINVALQDKALFYIVKRGDAKPHTAIVECKAPIARKYVKEQFRFYKTEPKAIIRATPELIEQHRAFLRKKYNGEIPYKYEQL